MSYKVNALQTTRVTITVNSARIIDNTGNHYKIILGSNHIIKTTMQVTSFIKLRKQKFLAVATAVLLALLSVFIVHAFENNQASANNSASSASSNNAGDQSQQSGDSQLNGQDEKSDGKSHNSSSTSITVNGRQVDVPQNGSFDTTKDGVRISGSNNQSSSSSGGSVSNHSSTSVNINSQ